MSAPTAVPADPLDLVQISPSSHVSVTGEKVDVIHPPEHIEDEDSKSTLLGNLVYADGDEEPEIHMRTWIACGSMMLLIFCQNMCLQGPPSVLSFIEADLGNTTAGIWIPNALVLVQAVVGPIICLASDTFQIRKPLLVGSCLVSMIGAGIAPGSKSIYRLIGAQVLIGFGFACIPLTYVMPNEILPRKWRPMTQSMLNVASAMTSIAGPLIGGSLITKNSHLGWRQFYKLQCLDLPGCALLTAGLVLLLVGLNLGGNPYPWTSAKVLVTMILGIVILGLLGIWEWKGTKNGLMSHELFVGPDNRGGAFAIYVCLIFIEAILLFTFAIFYPIMTTALFTTNALKSTARLMPYWVAFVVSTPFYGYVSTRFRIIREPLAFGFLFYTAGVTGLATIEPGQSFNQLAFAALAGLGFGAPIVLIFAGVQLNVPHHLIGTSTAVVNTSRAVGASIFTAIYAATLHKNLSSKIPSYVAAAVIKAGLPANSVPEFIGALTTANQTEIADTPGITPVIIAAGVDALRKAYADSLRTIFIIGAPFGLLACALCFLLGSYKHLMSYRVEAPVENLHAKKHDVKVAAA